MNVLGLGRGIFWGSVKILGQGENWRKFWFWVKILGWGIFLSSGENLGSGHFFGLR